MVKAHRPAPPPAYISEKGESKAGAQILSKEQPLIGNLYDCGHPTNEEQYLLELINRARANPDSEGIRLSTTTDPDISSSYAFFGSPTRAQVASDFSTYTPQPPLAFNADLINAARGHDRAMIQYDSQYHVGPDGSPTSRMTAAGYNITGWSGENVFAFGVSMYDIHASFLIDFGNPALGHRENILNFQSGGPQYSEIGIGVIHGSGNGSSQHVGPIVTTEDLAQGANVFVLGVVYSDQNGNGLYDIGEGDSGVKITLSSGTSYAVSSGSGGYAIPFSGSGTITVTASGGVFSSPVIKTIDFNGQNVKVDFSPDLSGYPTQVTLQSPLAAAIVSTDTVKFMWDSMAVATKYHIQIATDVLMKNLVLNDSSLINASRTFGALKDSTTYYWRVQAKNAKGIGAWSLIDSFTVALPPSAVALIAPANGSSVGDSNISFEWHAANKGASNFSYWLIISSHKAITDTVFQDTPADTSETVDTSNFVVGQTYYWEVLAQNDNGWSKAGAPWSFTLSSPASVTSAISKGSTAITAIPNPSIGSTKLGFSLIASEDVFMRVFNSAGEQVQSLDLGRLSTGSHEYLWDCSGLPDGTYTCQLRMGGYVENKRVVILK